MTMAMATPTAQTANAARLSRCRHRLVRFQLKHTPYALVGFKRFSSSLMPPTLPPNRQLTDNKIHTIEKDGLQDLVALERL